MLNNVDSSSGALVATGDNGYAISEKVALAENISIGNTVDVFESEYAILAGNRISIVVDGEYIKTKIEEANIISEGPFQYDTSAITNGAIPSEVFFTGDLRIEVVDMVMNLEFVNISTATVADTLTTTKSITESDNLLIVTSDDKIHKVPQEYITPEGEGSIVDTTPITNGEIPSRAYYANATLFFNDIEAEDKRVKYSTIVASENISAFIIKKGVVSISDNTETRIDFISTGDRMIDLNYNASILLNDRYFAPEFEMTRETSIDIRQSIIFNMN